MGPKTWGGGRYGGCLSAIYVFWASLGLTAKPMPVPRAMGRRIEAAGLEKIWEGRVRGGMCVVILGCSL